MKLKEDDVGRPLWRSFRRATVEERTAPSAFVVHRRREDGPRVKTWMVPRVLVVNESGMEEGISIKSVRQIIKQRLGIAVREGWVTLAPCERVSGHSLRVGTAQDIMGAMHAGRWATPAQPLCYAAKLALGRGAVAKIRRRRGAAASR